MLKFHHYLDLNGTPDSIYINPEYVTTVRQLTVTDFSVSPVTQTKVTEIIVLQQSPHWVKEPIDEVIKRLDFYFASQVDLMMVDQGRPM